MDGARTRVVVAWCVSVEVCSYRLSHKGKAVGTHVLKAESKGKVALLEGKAMFQGALGEATVLQRSRCHAARHYSLRFREETSERAGNRNFDVVFDAQDGMVRASKGRDEASTPYLRPYRDPLSLLFELRGMGELEHLRVPLLGKDVTVQRVGEVELDTVMGSRIARAYLLHPGGSVVYVDAREPHLLLKFTQRLSDGFVDALLVKVTEEATMQDWGDPGEVGGKGSGKRRRRSRRRRPRRNRRGNG